MTRTALVLALVAFAPTQARGQTNTDEVAVVLFSALSPALVFDVLIVTNLVRDGTVRKGFGINGIVFGGIAILLGGALALSLLNDTQVPSGWGLAAVGVAVLGAGTGVLGVYGLTHQHPLDRPGATDDNHREDAAPPPIPDEGPPPLPPPAPAEPLQVHLFPQLGLGPHGAVMFGLAGTL